MKPHTHILDELKNQENPFKVPEDYFETNALKLWEKIMSRTENPFDLPDDYFETNALKLPEKLLSSSAKQGFTVPEKYFDSQAQLLYQSLHSLKTKSKGSKKVIPFIRYLTAAASLIAVVTGIYVYQRAYQKIPLSNECKTIACLSKQDILSKNILLGEDILEESISDERIEQYFNNRTPPTLSDTNTHPVYETF